MSRTKVKNKGKEGSQPKSKTKKVLFGVAAVAATVVLIAAATADEDYSDDFVDEMKKKGIDFPDVPDSNECLDWEFDMSVGVWVCDEKGVAKAKHFYFKDTYYKEFLELHKNEAYKSYASSAGFAGYSKLSKDFRDGISRGTVMRGFGSDDSSGG